MPKRCLTDRTEDGQRRRTSWPAVTDGAIRLAEQLMSQMENCHCPMMQRCQDCQEALSQLYAIGADEWF